MIPRKLTDWNLDVIIKLLSQGYHESEDFDFKEQLPHLNDFKEKERLSKTCCAFANSSGGFLIFGIKDDKSLPPEDRLVGVDAKDFPEHFGNYPTKCTPSVYWNYLNPPIKLSNGNLIHVVEIPKSWNAPHSIKYSGKNGDESWFFMKRTNKGNEHMTQEEIKLTYLGYYEKRIKLQLLYAELKNLIDDANNMLELATKDRFRDYPLGNFNLNVIEAVLVDVYTILAEKSELLALLNKLRGDCRVINRKIQIFHDTISHPIAEDAIRNATGLHNDYLARICPRVKDDVEQALSYLESFLKNN